jgi:ketosteroid isomerase-like protein
MILRRVLIGFVAATTLTAACLAQASDRESDHESLRQVMKKATAAINAQDVSALAACLAKEFVFVPVDQTVITNQQGIVAYFDRMLKGKDAPLASLMVKPEADVLTRFVDANAGYCYGKSVDAYTLKDKRIFTLNVRWTALVVKEDGQWKAAAIHTGVDLLDNPVLTARSMSFWRKLGVLLHLVTPPYTMAK